MLVTADWLQVRPRRRAEVKSLAGAVGHGKMTIVVVQSSPSDRADERAPTAETRSWSAICAPKVVCSGRRPVVERGRSPIQQQKRRRHGSLIPLAVG